MATPKEDFGKAIYHLDHPPGSIPGIAGQSLWTKGDIPDSYALKCLTSFLQNLKEKR
jgi:hypothetical protein